MRTSVRLSFHTKYFPLRYEMVYGWLTTIRCHLFTPSVIHEQISIRDEPYMWRWYMSEDNAPNTKDVSSWFEYCIVHIFGQAVHSARAQH